ncbi:MAG: hypothetical protein V1779_07960 [bacterium]
MKKLITLLSIILAFAGCKTVEICPPVIYSPTYVTCFDKVPAVFEFAISPYHGNGINVVVGKVLDMKGDSVATLTCIPLYQIADVMAYPPTPYGKQEWRGTVDKILPEGKYKIELSHECHELFTMSASILEIFKTGLINADELDRNLNFLTVYGSRLSINAQPFSGSKIIADQFRIYLSTDVDKLSPPFAGLYMDETIEIGAKANNVTLEVVWIQPYTNKEVVLFQEKNYSIKQKQPTINTRNQRVIADSEDGKKISIVSQSLEIFYPPIGTLDESSSKKAEIKISAKNGTVNINGGTYEFSSDPQIETEFDENSIRVRIFTELTGSLDKGQKSIEGTISLELRATAINPINGKASDIKKEPITVPINISIDKSGKEKK